MSNDSSLSSSSLSELQLPSFCIHESTNRYIFFRNTILACVFALFIGGLINSFSCEVLKHLQIDPKNEKSVVYHKALIGFSFQLITIIVFLLVCVQINKNFIAFMQLTVSGILFSVLLFSVQYNLFDNAMTLTDISKI